MNIIIDECTYSALLEHLITTIEFGSSMKGHANSQSDHDYLHIIQDSEQWLIAPVNTHHLLQYRTGSADHIFCTPSTFVKSLLDGDSTIFHEMLRFGALDDTCLSFLNNYKFDHYKTMRAYLGIARRDLKEVTKLWKTDPRKARKKLKFSVDAINYVKKTRGLDILNLPVANELSTIHDVIKYTKSLLSVIDHDRKQINKELDADLIARTLPIEDITVIHSHLIRLQSASYSTGLIYFYQSHIEGK